MIAQDLTDAIQSVASDWKKAKRRADREDRVSRRDLGWMRMRKLRELSVKEAAFQVMAEAYAHASANGTLPANARQIMYAARPLVLKLTGEKCWKQSSYFTQHLLPDFMEEHPGLTANWDVVFDDRGHFVEPHTDKRIGLGTLAVRGYTAGWRGDIPADESVELARKVDTSGPANRYKFALFVEKEGFNPLLERAGVTERFDIALMSNKGMSVTAGRMLVERLSREDVMILVLHDFDKAGFSIVNTLCSDTRRYTYRTEPNVLDLGLRLEDVEAMGLEGESVDYNGDDPHANLRDNGATEEEIAYLVRERDWNGRWRGERVELNAMTSQQFLEWLEGKLAAAGVEKVVPDADTLAKAYRRAVRRAVIQEAIDEADENYEDDAIEVPDDLRERITQLFKKDMARAWDDVLFDIASAEVVAT